MKAWNVVYDFCIAVQCLLLNSYVSNASGSAFSHAGQLTFPKFSWQTINTLREVELFFFKIFKISCGWQFILNGVYMKETYIK